MYTKSRALVSDRQSLKNALRSNVSPSIMGLKYLNRDLGLVSRLRRRNPITNLQQDQLCSAVYHQVRLCLMQKRLSKKYILLRCILERHSKRGYVRGYCTASNASATTTTTWKVFRSWSTFTHWMENHLRETNSLKRFRNISTTLCKNSKSLTTWAPSSWELWNTES